MPAKFNVIDIILWILLASWLWWGFAVHSPPQAVARPQQEDGYRTMRLVTAQKITDATAAESLDGSTLIPGRAQETKGNPTVIVNVDFSGAAADTVVVYCLLYNKDAAGALEWTRAYQKLTATAGDILDAAGDNAAPSLYFDTSSVSHYEIRHDLPSAGNVDLVWWTFGVSPE